MVASSVRMVFKLDQAEAVFFRFDLEIHSLPSANRPGEAWERIEMDPIFAPDAPANSLTRLRMSAAESWRLSYLMTCPPGSMAAARRSSWGSAESISAISSEADMRPRRSRGSRIKEGRQRLCGTVSGARICRDF